MRSIFSRFKPKPTVPTTATATATATTLLLLVNNNNNNNNNKMGAFSSRMMLSNANNVSNNNSNSNNSGNEEGMMKKKQKEKVVIIMGPTGSGKSRLSMDIANRIGCSEIINSDKVQFYKGLDITTNKVPLHQRRHIPHHFLGEFDPSTHPLLSRSQFRSMAASVISSVNSRRHLPLLVGGSNSYIYALLADNFDPTSNVFGPGSPNPNPELRYECCFLWVDIDEPVLNEYLMKRVDEMVDSGMVDELSEFYESEIDELEEGAELRKAIGVPEFEGYFRGEEGSTDIVRYGAYKEAVKKVKANTCQLAKEQLGKIKRLKNAGWDLHRLDGTDSFRAVLDGSKGWADIWENNVVKPSIKIVTNFLEE